MGKHGAMMLGGHRGMGENLATTSKDGKLGVYPAYRENTIHSFQQAVKCGVGFVEFDVQVTRDNVPVIWHDDDVVLGPADHPSRPQVKDLTLAELQALCGRARAGRLHAPSPAPAASSGGTPPASTSGDCCRVDPQEEERRSSNGAASGRGEGQEAQPRELLRRFRDRATRQWVSSYERWSCEQDDTIPTLEAVFSSLPPEIGFDIEIKMTTGDDIVHTPAEEVDRMLSAILPVVDKCTTLTTTTTAPSTSTTSSTSSTFSFTAAGADFGLAGISPPDSPLPTTSTNLDSGGSPHRDLTAPAPASATVGPRPGRRIMFSSFDPDVCVELRRRQSAHPVYYLSGCGLYEHADARRTSIPAALSFAEEAGMRGIVMPASVLMKNLDMVASASRSRLELMTYGLENNDLDCLRAQADAGVTAAIVDEVAGVTAALAGPEEEEEGKKEEGEARRG